MVENSQDYPYETRLNIACQPLQLIDGKALADACRCRWYNPGRIQAGLART